MPHPDARCACVDEHALALSHARDDHERLERCTISALASHAAYRGTVRRKGGITVRTRKIVFWDGRGLGPTQMRRLLEEVSRGEDDVLRVRALHRRSCKMRASGWV
jgi:hypothetical protein